MAISPEKKPSKKAASKKTVAGRAKPAHVKHIETLAKTDPKLRRLVAKYGIPKPIAQAAFTAATIRPHDICMETDCVDGKKIVMRRDKSGDCSDYSEVDC